MNCILLATYNGARFLPALLQSIRDQTVDDWRLLARDDGSTDGTPALLAKAAVEDSRVTVVTDTGQRKGVAQNFGTLMQHALQIGAQYVFFADQDDVWLPHKLHTCLAGIQAKQSTPHLPILLHTDGQVVNQQLRIIHPSRTAYVSLDLGGEDPLRTLLVYNFVAGCVAALNRPLLELAVPLPTQAVMHDWWTALCAAAFGEVVYIPEPTVLYRQHDANLVGAQNPWRRMTRLASRRGPGWNRLQQEFASGIRQAVALRHRLEMRSTYAHGDAADMVDDYCALFQPGRSTAHRMAGVRRLGIGRLRAWRQLWLFLRVATASPMRS